MGRCGYLKTNEQLTYLLTLKNKNKSTTTGRYDASLKRQEDLLLHDVRTNEEADPRFTGRLGQNLMSFLI